MKQLFYHIGFSQNSGILLRRKVNHQFTWVSLWKAQCTKYCSLVACIISLAFAHP